MRFTNGYVKIRVQGYSTERFLNLCSHHRIYIWGLEPKGDTYELYMTLKGFRKLRPLVRKTHTRVTLIRRCGLPFFIYQNRQRQAFLVGLILCISLLFLYSTFIWDIHFEGNEKWTNETLLEFLETKNVTPAMPKSQVNCPQIVKDIRARYNDIVWVSASIDGSRLRIQIKENEDTFQEEEEESAGDHEAVIETAEEIDNKEHPTDLIASEDGVITSIITRSGVPQVHVGDTVKKGDVLVSGRIEVLNDAKEVVDYQYCQSDADIFADTELTYQDSVSRSYEQKQYDKKKQREAFFIKIGSRMISVGFTKVSGKNCEKYTSEHHMKLGENFYLPFSYGKIMLKPYTTKTKKYEKEKLQVFLTEKFNSFLNELEEKGIQIREKDVKIHLDENSATAKGTLYLNKQIAETVDTEILVIERNEQNESIGTDN